MLAPIPAVFARATARFVHAEESGQGMERSKQDQQWKPAGGRRAAWLLIFCALVFTCLPPSNPALAQETTRKVKSSPPPEYPELARKLNIKGLARVRFTITKDGKVRDVKEVGGNPVLVTALVEAVKKWKYEPAPMENDAEAKYDFQ